MSVRFPKSDWYPLPPDYPDLTAEGMRLARVNAVSLQDTPDDLVSAWAFLRSYYLRDDAESLFSPGWYKAFTKSPPVHSKIVWYIGRYPFNALAIPRGFAKSTVLMELAMTLWLARHNFRILLIYSTGTMVRDRFSNQLMYQFTDNERIRNDFGDLEPSRGKGMWNSSMLTNAQNRSVLAGMPIKGKLLGQRPDFILTDDCEHDPEMEVKPTELIENMDRFMHNVVLPMRGMGNFACSVVGTLFSSRSWLARWLHADAGKDARVGYWNRILYSAEDKNEDGSLLWEERFGEERLEEARVMYGAAYGAQVLNRPGEVDAQVLEIDEDLGQYSVENQDEHYKDIDRCPLHSNAALVSYRKTQEEHLRVTRPFGETVQKMSRYVFLDYAKCNTPQSDFVNMLVLGVESNRLYKDTWWVLDNYMDRIRGEDLYRKLFQLAFRWRVRGICIESVGGQIGVMTGAEVYSYIWQGRDDWVPRLYPVTYPNGMEKEERMLNLQPRFYRHRVKLPLHLKHRFGVRELYFQIEQFTGEKGKLRFDDALDTLAMPQFFFRNGTTLAPDIEHPSEMLLDPNAYLGEGRTHTESGVWVGGIPISLIQRDTREALERTYESNWLNRRRDLRWTRVSGLGRRR